MPMSIRRTRLRAAELTEKLEVADNWRVTAAERALHFSLEWDALLDQAPKEIEAELRQLGDRVADTSPTFKQLARPKEMAT